MQCIPLLLRKPMILSVSENRAAAQNGNFRSATFFCTELFLMKEVFMYGLP